MEYTIKCRKCRIQLASLQPEYLVDGHGSQILFEIQQFNAISCVTVQEKNELFLHEDYLPEWIFKEIERSQWTKGKLKCSGCDSRVGSFDFVSGTRCQCTEMVLPPVHLVKSKVDVPVNVKKT